MTNTRIFVAVAIVAAFSAPCGVSAACKLPRVANAAGDCVFCGLKGNPPCPASLGIDPCYVPPTAPPTLRVQPINNICTTCGLKGLPACPEGAACTGDRLTPVGTPPKCTACGARGQVSCNGKCILPNLFVKNGICTLCGGLGQPPCPGSGCVGGLEPLGGVCSRCGALDQPPCSAGCDAGLTVDQGVCNNCGNKLQLPCSNGKCNGNLVISKRVQTFGRCVAPQ